MQVGGPNIYTEISQKDFDQLKQQFKAVGAPISANRENVTIDGVGVRVDYDPDKETLTFTVASPFWLPEATTLGFLHGLVARAEAASKEMANQEENAVRRAQKPDEDVSQHPTSLHEKPAHQVAAETHKSASDVSKEDISAHKATASAHK